MPADKPIRNNLGFTMIELLCVIIIIATLGGTALDQFIDFRNEAKAAALVKALSTIRQGIKNQNQNAMLRCGAAPNSGVAPGGGEYYLALQVNFLTNDITAQGGANRICTTSQLPDPNDRKFWNIDNSDTAKQYLNGNQIGVGQIPANPFITSRSANLVGRVVVKVQQDFDDNGGPCGLGDSIAVTNFRNHWLYNSTTGEIYAGTNTPGIHECNF